MLTEKEVVKFDSQAAALSVVLNGPITQDGGNFTEVKSQVAECLRGILNREMKRTRSASRKRDLKEFGEQRGTHKVKVKLQKRKHLLPRTSGANPFGVKSKKLEKALMSLSKTKQDAIAELIMA